MNAFEIQEAAYRTFDRWCAEHDPDGSMDILEAAVAYSEWASKNSIAPYLDADDLCHKGNERENRMPLLRRRTS